MKRELVAYTDPTSTVSEMFKTLRTNIQFMNTNKVLKTLLVSSTLPGEGKSWTAANLAVSFAQAGKKVLLVDADMRKGRQFNIFEVNPTPGLSNFLSGVLDGENRTCELQDVIQQTEIENLSIITAGVIPPNPAELLVSEKMLELNSKVKEMYDLTIFDGTPSLLVADAPILSRIADSTIIVTAHNETKIDNVEKVKKAIENVGGKVAGVVVNKIPVTANKYKNTYYYGYGSNKLAVIKEKKAKKLRKKSNRGQDEHFVEKFERDFDLYDFKNETNLEVNEFEDETNFGVNEFEEETNFGINEFKNETNLKVNEFENETNLEVNEFEDETNLEINEFENETNLEVNEFENETNLEVNEFENEAKLEVNEYENVTNLETNNIQEEINNSENSEQNYNQDHENNKIRNTFEATQEVMNQINSFLFNEQNNFNNGGTND